MFPYVVRGKGNGMCYQGNGKNFFSDLTHFINLIHIALLMSQSLVRLTGCPNMTIDV